jgi:hypothetical protein
MELRENGKAKIENGTPQTDWASHQLLSFDISFLSFVERMYPFMSLITETA